MVKNQNQFDKKGNKGSRYSCGYKFATSQTCFSEFYFTRYELF